MNKTVPVIGFLILSVLVLSLFGFATCEVWRLSQPVGGVIVAIIFLGLLFKIVREGQGLSNVKMDGVFTQKNRLNFAAVFIAAIASHILNVNVGLGSVVAAGVIAIIAAFAIPEYGVPIACGSYVGMASTNLLTNTGELAMAAIVAGVVYVLTSSVFGGFGGKLGTIACIGCVATGLCLTGEFSSPAVAGWDVGWLLVVYSIIGAVVTFYINHNLGHGAVMASGIVALVAGLVLPIVHPEIGGKLAVMVICASFAGMSSNKHFPSIVPMAIAGLFTGLVFFYGAPFIGGAGGKLGTTAFGSVLAVRGYMDFIEMRTAKMRAAKKQPA